MPKGRSAGAAVLADSTGSHKKVRTARRSLSPRVQPNGVIGTKISSSGGRGISRPQQAATSRSKSKPLPVSTGSSSGRSPHSRMRNAGVIPPGKESRRVQGGQAGRPSSRARAGSRSKSHRQAVGASTAVPRSQVRDAGDFASPLRRNTGRRTTNSGRKRRAAAATQASKQREHSSNLSRARLPWENQLKS